MSGRLSGNLVRAILLYGQHHDANKEIIGGWSDHEHKMVLTMVKMGILARVEKFMTIPRYSFTDEGLKILAELRKNDAA